MIKKYHLILLLLLFFFTFLSAAIDNQESYRISHLQQYVIPENVEQDDYVGVFYINYWHDTISSVFFEILNPELRNIFKIDPSTGLIQVNNPDEIPAQQSFHYELIIQISDGDLTQLDTAIIFVEKQEDCIFVDPLNTGIKDGSREHPYSHFNNEVRDILEPGKTCFIKRGREAISSDRIIINDGLIGNEDNPIRIASYGYGEKPVYDGWEFNDNEEGLTVGRSEPVNPAQYTYIYDIRFTNWPNVCIRINPSVKNCQLWRIEASYARIYSGFYLWPNIDLSTDPQNNLVSDCISYNNNTHGFKVSSNSSVVQNCKAYNNSISGLGNGIGTPDGNDIKVIYCICYNNNNGIAVRSSNSLFKFNRTFNNVVGIKSFKSPSNSVIECCKSYNNSYHGIGIYEESKNIDIKNNELYENLLNGVRITGESENITVSQCNIYENSKCGILVNLHPDFPNKARNIALNYNIIRNNVDDGIQLENCSDVYVYNNTIFGNLLSLNSNATTQNIVIRNNLLKDFIGGDIYSNNLNYADIPIGFVDTATFNFRLLYGSPAIDAGIEVGLDYDFEGNLVPFNTAPDIGAYEFVLRNPSDTLPHTPSNLSGNALLYYRAVITWEDNSDNEYGFHIERSQNPETGFQKIHTVYQDVTSYTNNGLSPLTTYYYRVCAYNNIGSSGYSDTISITTPAIPPPVAPSSLRSTDIKARYVSLRWNDNSNDEERFELERSNVSGSEFSVIATLSANQITYTNDNLTPLSTYYYRIRAYNQHGYSTYSNELGISTPDLQPPAAPSGLNALNITKNSLLLRWVDNASNEASFRIYRSLTPGSGYTQIGAVGANILEFADSGLEPVTVYYYRIRAYNEDGYSAYSNELTVTTAALQPPAAPSNLTATHITKNSLVLHWEDNSNNETGFRIRRSLTSGSGYVTIATIGANILEYADSGLEPSTTYFYRLRAYNEDGNSSYSSEFSVTTADLKPPSAPTKLETIYISNNSATLEWVDNSNDESGFEIFRAFTDSINFRLIHTTPQDINTYTDSILLADTTYLYSVRAVNDDGYSDFTNILSVKTLPYPPPKNPTGLTLREVTKYTVSINWFDNSDDEDGFEIERSVDTHDNYEVITTLEDNITDFLDVELIPNTTYYYRIRAFNQIGYSDYSNIVSITTISLESPDNPALESINIISDSAVNLIWKDNSDNESGFQIERADESYDYMVVYTAGTNDTTWTDSSLYPGITYHYRIKAVNDYGASGYSNVLEVIIEINDPPVAPSSLKAESVNDNSITLKWSDNSANETGFIIKRALEPDKNFRIITTLQANNTSFTDENLSSNTIYYYLVNAVNNTGVSDNSNTAIASTMSVAETKRVWDGLVAYYNFNLNSGHIIHDFSNYKEPLDLDIKESSGIVWENNNKFEIISDAYIKSITPATKIVEACKKTNEITIECWLKPSLDHLNRISNILIIAKNTEDIGALLAQEHIFDDKSKSYNYLIRLKTKATATNGAPELYAADELSFITLHHLIYTKDKYGIEKIYLNGEEVASNIRPEGMDNWNNEYYLMLGNDIDQNYPWYGTYYNIAIYNNALSKEQILGNYEAGPSDNLANTVIDYDIEIYPNPSEDIINLRIIPQSENEFADKTMIQISNIMGDIIYSEIIEDPNREMTKSIDLSVFTKGIYILRIITKDHFNSERLILK